MLILADALQDHIFLKILAQIWSVFGLLLEDVYQVFGICNAGRTSKLFGSSQDAKGTRETGMMDSLDLIA